MPTDNKKEVTFPIKIEGEGFDKIAALCKKCDERIDGVLAATKKAEEKLEEARTELWKAIDEVCGINSDEVSVSLDREYEKHNLLFLRTDRRN